MTKRIKRLEADIVIAGGGPGGCALASDLSKKGKNVILLEKGSSRTPLNGTPAGMLLNVDRAVRFPMPVRGTLEGENVIMGSGPGGGTLFYAGSAFLPDIAYWNRVGIDIPDDIIKETVQETRAALPPDDFIGNGTRSITDAALALGYPFEKCMRHVDFNLCREGCDRCVLGCTSGAKWHGGYMARDAEDRGGRILTHVRADSVIIKNGSAAGVKAHGIFTRERYEIYAPVVVCAAGGVGTTGILRKSGIEGAGSWFSGDPTTFIFGFLPKGSRGNGGEHPMTCGWHDESHRIIWCAMASPSPAWHLMFIQDEGIRALSRLHRYSRVLSLFAKCSDDGVGRVFPNGDISNTFTEADLERQQYGRDVGQKILIEAGCDPRDIHVTGMTLGHPGGTVRVGELLDTTLQVKGVDRLYCCDTSIMPGAPGRPPTLTITALGKRLARHILSL